MSGNIFSKEEKERYSRQILLFGANKQEILKKANILVIGAGGIGCPLLQYLVASGIGNVNIIEYDIIERSNLGRQILFSENNIGFSKGVVALESLKKINPYVDVKHISDSFSVDKHLELFQNASIVLEGTDSIQNKFLINDLSLKYNKLSLIAALGPRQGHIIPISSETNTACYRCLFEDNFIKNDTIPTCSTEGIISALPGVIGSMMAYLTILYLLEKQDSYKIFILDQINWRTIHLAKRDGCMCQKLC